jgi:hypothetical protein
MHAATVPHQQATRTACTLSLPALALAPQAAVSTLSAAYEKARGGLLEEMALRGRAAAAALEAATEQARRPRTRPRHLLPTLDAAPGRALWLACGVWRVACAVARAAGKLPLEPALCLAVPAPQGVAGHVAITLPVGAEAATAGSPAPPTPCRSTPARIAPCSSGMAREEAEEEQQQAPWWMQVGVSGLTLNRPPAQPDARPPLSLSRLGTTVPACRLVSA